MTYPTDSQGKRTRRILYALGDLVVTLWWFTAAKATGVGPGSGRP